MQKQLKSIKRAFGYTAYTWGNAATNGWKGKAKLSAIESLRGQVEQIEISQKHSAIVTSGGELYTWGDAKYGKLGFNTPEDSKIAEPTLVSFFSKNNIKVKSVSLGRNHTLALDTKGRLFSFGKGVFSGNALVNLLFAKYVALGHPKAENVFFPKLVEKLRDTPIAQTSTGRHFALALSEAGQLLVWGRGEFGVLGCRNSDSAEPMVNEVVAALCREGGVSVRKIDSCSDFSSVLFSDGSVRSFGNNDQGNMGIGGNLGVDFCEAINVPTLMEFPDQPQRVADIDLAEMTTALLTEQGKVYICGLKLYFFPELLALNYDLHKVKTFGACDRGVAIVTNDNKLFAKGNFWINEGYDEDVNTGISEIDVAKYFDGRELVKVGGKYAGRFVLVKEKD